MPPALDPADRDLCDAALAARERAWAPYSKFRVGAALALDDGSVVTGCNVENASFGLTICAERSAVVRAVSEGRRAFRALAVASDAPGPVMPCGACRQVLAEFAPKLRVLAVGAEGGVREACLDQLLPDVFDGPTP